MALAVAALVWIIEWVVRSRRLQVAMDAAGASLPLKRALSTQLVGEAYGAVTPGRVGSDPARVVWMGRPVDRAIAGIALEMLTEAVAVLIVVVGFVIAVMTLPIPALDVMGSEFAGAGLTGGVMLMVLAATPSLGTIAIWLTALKVCPEGGKDSTEGQAGPVAGIRALINRVGQARKILITEGATIRSVLPALMGLSFVRTALRVSILPILLGALDNGVFASIVLLYAGLLVPTPSGAGGIELAFGWLLGPAPVVALPVLIVWWRLFTQYFGAVGGGLLLLARRGRRSRGPESQLHDEGVLVSR